MKKTLIAMLATAAALSAQAETIELLTNGAGTTLEGWTNTGDDSGIRFGILTVDEISWFSSRRNQGATGGSDARLSQTVVLADLGISEDEIQMQPTVTASAIVAAPLVSSSCNIKVCELDANGNETPHLIMNREGEQILDPVPVSSTFDIDPSTRKLKYVLTGIDRPGWSGDYGPRFRSCSLSITRRILTFVSDGTTIGTTNFLVGGSVPTITPPIASREGAYHFLGYYTEEVGGLQVVDENNNVVAGALSSLTADTTLYAHWIREIVNFTFVSTGSTVGTVNYQIDSTAPTAPTATRSGDYTFLGYFTEETGGVQVYDADCHFVQSSLSSLSSDMTLYAQWALPEGSIAKLVYRGQLNLLTGEPATSDSTYTKTMHFRVYDGAEATTPLWSIDDQEVTVNADGSFVHAFGDETLAALIATGKVTHVGLAIGPSASTAVELKPRRELRPVAAVNRALTAEGAAPDIRVGNLVTENALVAADATVSQLEVAGTVTAPGAGKVEVSPLVVGPDERTRLLRGKGVTAFSREKPTTLDLAISGAVLRGQVLATAPSDGIALISSKATGERALRCPAVIQYCREGEKVRAPTSDAGGLKVTFFPFVGKEGK
jgi:hypothetical protein